VLAGCEIALATVLLVGAGLLTQTLANLQRAHLGFDPHGIITFQLAPPGAQYPNARAALLYRDLIEALQALPGVSGAAVSSGIPFGQGTYSTHPMVAVGTSVLAPETLVPIDWRIVSPGYFKTLQIPLVRGRTFTDADGSGTTPPVLIVSQATAKKFWGDADPIGRALTRSADRSVTFTVVGVVGDVRSTALNQESPALYYPVAWRVWPVMDVVARTSGSPEALLPSIRQKVRELDAQLALANIRTLDEWVVNSAAQPRLDSVLLAVFAGVALVIAAIGIYGVLAYSVSQRTREIGLRIAVGARPASVVRLVVAEGMTVAAVGICTGLFVASATGRALASLLYGVQPRDPATFGFIAAVLTFVAVAACAIPARRAARVDPMVALRHE
jgi:putative ABC transport system permease protein